MKRKFIFLLAALMASMFMFAERPTHADGVRKAPKYLADDVNLTSYSLSDWVVSDATKNAEKSTDKKWVYDIAGGIASESYIDGHSDIVFRIQNGSDKEEAFNINDKIGYEFGGKNGVLIVKGTGPGQEITIVAAAKGSKDASLLDPSGVYPKNAVALTKDANLVLPAKNKDKAGTEGYDDQGYHWDTLRYLSSGGDVEIKEFNAGYRIKLVSVGANSITPITVADALAIGAALVDDVTDTVYAVLGYVVEDEGYVAALGCQTVRLKDNTADPEDLECYHCSAKFDNGVQAKMAVGDQVVMVGRISKMSTLVAIEDGFSYFSDPNFSGDHYVPTVFAELRVDDVLTTIGSALSPSETTPYSYWTYGYVSNIELDKFETTGEQNIWIADDAASSASSNADGAFLVYAKPKQKLQKGDFVKVLTRVKKNSSGLIMSERYLPAEIVTGTPQFPDCYATLSMIDSYGDGWNGGHLTVSDGTHEFEYALTATFDVQYLLKSGTDLIPYYGKPMHFSWTEGNDNYSSEVGFTVTDPFGRVIFEHEAISGVYFYSEDNFFTMMDLCTPVPTESDLIAAGYDPTTNLVFCARFIEDATVCNDIYFIGTCTSWNLTKDYPFKELSSFPGWYAVEVPYTTAMEGKPMHVRYDGELDNRYWRFQPGAEDAWINVGSNAATFSTVYGGDEVNVSYPSAGAYIYRITRWKDKLDPCVPPVEHNYTFKVYPPKCTSEDFEPALIGLEGDWTNNVAMTQKFDLLGNAYYEFTATMEELEEYKIRELNDNSWSNEILKYNSATDTWESMPNFKLPVTSETNCTIIHDFSTPEYIWGACSDPYTKPTSFNVAVGIIPPAGVPAPGIEIAGSFASEGVKMDEASGAYYVILSNVDPTTHFGFRQAGDEDWMNYIMVKDGGAWIGADYKFEDLWKGGAEYGYPGYKYIGLDMSDPEKYKWSLAPGECYYQLVLTDIYNDGWDGDGHLTVKDGDAELTYYLESNKSPKIIDVPYYGHDVTFTYGWTDGSDPFSNEVSFGVLASNGAVLFYHPQGEYIVNNNEVVYTMKLSPCKTGTNPYIPQNIQAALTDDNKLKVTWDATSGAASYLVSLVDAYGGNVASNIKIGTNSFVSDKLTNNGEYTIMVISCDAEGMALGYGFHSEIVMLHTIPSATINVLIPSDSDVDASDGLWLVWWPEGGENDTVKMATTDHKLFTKEIAPNALSYGYSVITKEHASDPGCQISGYWSSLRATTHCSEALHYEGSIFHLKRHADCNMPDHDYRVYSLGAVSSIGGVSFSWDAKDKADSYRLTLYDADNSDAVLTSFTISNLEDNIYDWGVPDDYDGKNIKWSLRAYEPYELEDVTDAVGATLTKSAVSLSSFTAKTEDNKTIDLAWDFSDPSLNYIVEIEYSGKPVLRQYTHETEFHYTAVGQGDYVCYVTPLDAYNNIAGTRQMATPNKIALTDAPKWITGLTGTANKHHLEFSWATAADKTHVRLYQKIGYISYLIKEEETDQTSWSYDVAEDGKYWFYVSPMVEFAYGQYSTLSWTESIAIDSYDAPTMFPVQIKATEGGSLSTGNINNSYPEGAIISIQAYTSDINHIFTGWSDGVTEDGRDIYIYQDTVITANFAELVKLTISTPANGSIGVQNYYNYDGNVYYFPVGATAVLTAYPLDGYQFDSWTDDATIKSSVRSIEITSDFELSAAFAATSLTNTYSVNITSEDETKGTVTNINGTWLEGTTLEVVATPKPGYDFLEWSNGAKTPTYSFELTQDTAFTAKFQKQFFTLALDADEGGTTDPVPGKYTYDYGEYVAFSAVANTGWHFVQWSDGNTDIERQVKITGPVSFKAQFEKDYVPATYTFDFGKIGNGTVTADKPAGTYDEGTEITLTATPETGWHFVKWSNEATTTTVTITLTANTTMTATFAENGGTPNTYTFAFGKTGLGEVTADKAAGTYDEGTSITLTATPAADWDFAGWVVNGGTPIMTNPLTVTLTENTTVNAVFTTTKMYKVTIKVGPDKGGKIKPTGYSKKEVLGGTQLEIEAIPDDDYRFVEWEEDGNTDEKRTITITQDTVLTAIFAEIEWYTLKVEIYPSEEAGNVLFDGKEVSKLSKSYEEGTSVKLTAVANEGYVFNYFEDKNTTSDNAEFTVKMTGNKNITAYFKKKTQGLDDIDASERAVKVLINGEIYILRGDRIYTVQGQIVQ